MILGAVARSYAGDPSVMHNYARSVASSGITMSTNLKDNLSSLGYDVENKTDSLEGEEDA